MGEKTDRVYGADTCIEALNNMPTQKQNSPLFHKSPKYPFRRLEYTLSKVLLKMAT